MPNEDHPATAPPPHRPIASRRVWIVLALLAVGGLLFAVLAVGDDDGSDRVVRSDRSDATLSKTPSTVGPQTELVARLEEILARRGVAYRERDPEILKEIDTEDCPCLKSDSNAIRELLSEDYNWVGGKTSIRVRHLERVTERMWIIIADFTSEPLRIETASGRPVRTEPRGSDLFQFVLARPTDSNQWLLGRASSHETG